ncbi:hypothetical protein CAL29_08660 [Bordetella genomosp. 10]|uniref:Knr4/Smi1-like domain-containing protein n=1 Tax=Bordetella genomosp. 10 TaxID=1416804 RepID=A0A261SMQ6_9BORD|nr:SMI1/KNR4 family protein [Bordetella genomosp. 10]OZI38371.1 hypothetical protein CAL29_08660 [Bordetella genomosp. 10]
MSGLRDLAGFQELADALGVPLSPVLAQCVERGLACYPDDYRDNYGAILQSRPPALASTYDFEWMGLDEARTLCEEWLVPSSQGGNAFLPFAMSGAGDVYALIRLADGRGGCGVVLHDQDDSEMRYGGFEDFVCAQLLDTLRDLSHLTDDFDIDTAAQCVRADISRLAPLLPPQAGMLLMGAAAREPFPSSIQRGPRARPEDVPALVTAREHADLIARFLLPAPVTFNTTPPWEI